MFKAAAKEGESYGGYNLVEFGEEPQKTCLFVSLFPLCFFLYRIDVHTTEEHLIGENPNFKVPPTISA